MYVCIYIYIYIYISCIYSRGVRDARGAKTADGMIAMIAAANDDSYNDSY